MTFRRTTATLLALFAAMLVAPSVASAVPSFKTESRARVDCGSQQVFHRDFQVAVRGKPLPCGQARRIASGKCKIRMKHRWSCFSFAAPDPFLAWFRSRQLFDATWTTAIIFERYPCADAEVTRQLFETPARGFPSFRQLLADDVVRCDLLAGADKATVKAMLGRPDERGGRGSDEYWDYQTGLERDSIFQLDSEVLSVSFKHGIVKSVGFFQG